MTLAERTLSVTRHFPRDERFELTRQIRRASASVPSNIAEGAGRGTDREFARFLKIAYGSACELETQLRLAHSQEIGKPAELAELIRTVDRVRGLLAGLIKVLVSSEHK